jgi:hypothetical protein
MNMHYRGGCNHRSIKEDWNWLTLYINIYYKTNCSLLKASLASWILVISYWNMSNSKTPWAKRRSVCDWSVFWSSHQDIRYWCHKCQPQFLILFYWSVRLWEKIEIREYFCFWEMWLRKSRIDTKSTVGPLFPTCIPSDGPSLVRTSDQALRQSD